MKLIIPKTPLFNADKKIDYIEYPLSLFVKELKYTHHKVGVQYDRPLYRYHFEDIRNNNVRIFDYNIHSMDGYYFTYVFSIRNEDDNVGYLMTSYYISKYIKYITLL